MYPYSRSVTPAVKNHLEAQLAFFNSLSKSMFHSVQHFNDLNMQLAQGLLEETTVTGQNLLTVERAEDVFQVAAAAGQPAAEQLRKYQQQLSRLAADTQVELANVAERDVLGLGEPQLPDTDVGQSLVAQQEAFEAQCLRAALTRHKGDIKAVLNELQLPRRTLNEKMQRHGLVREAFLSAE